MQATQIPWVYCPTIPADASCVALSESEAHHVLHVLRCRSGATVAVFNGDGALRIGQLQPNGKECIVMFTDPLQTASKVSSEWQLVLALPNQSSTFDAILPKASELGIARIQPVYAERTERGHWEPIWGKRLERWQRILIEACKQAKNPYVPKLLDPIALSQLPTKSLGNCFHGSLNAAGAAIQLPQTSSVCSVVVGSEGGFTAAEEAFLATFSTPVCLPTYVLRMETAVVSLVAALKTQVGYPYR
ncbi:MAG: 16S rRNA (uracil(1498)-N(3))-methyltransferase [Opitutales bacterium]|nr:16S rRNA (uracil(1498)-N(3))-methyltransferase [Opitutales bacterium]